MLRTLIALASFLIGTTVFADDLIELPEIGDSAGSVISYEQERRLGADFMRQVRRFAPLNTDEEVEAYIENLGRSLAQHIDYYGDFHFFVIDAPVINAFAVPGGYIAAYTGLILESQSESELASVMAHEIVHITQRHGARSIEAAKKMGPAGMVALVGALALAVADPQAGTAALIATQAAQQQMQINFTRENEREADRIGIQLLARSGYDPEKMAVFFERMQRASRYTDPSHIPEILRTHPVTINRIAEAKDRAEELSPEIIRQDSYEYHLIKAKLNVAAQPQPALAKSIYEAKLRDGEYVHEEVARYGYALALSASGDIDRARVEIEKLREAYPTIMAFQIAAAKIERRANDYLAARDIYAAAFAGEPENRAVVYGYVDTLILAEEPDLAKRILRQWGLSDRRDPRYYKLLAQAENDLGDRGNSHHSLAEYYIRIGETALAAEQLRLAKAVPELSNYQRQKILARLDEVQAVLLREDRDRRGPR
ncbi:MAG: M48 family metalloprotease [Pseudomonadota bacterium]